MCGKKSKHGLRAIVVSFVLLVLVLSPLAAWPFSFGKQEVQSPSPVQIYQDQSTETEAELLQRVKLLESQLKESESLRIESSKQLEILSDNLEKSGVKLGNTQATAESLLNEIDTLRRFLDSSEASRIALEIEYEALLADYHEKASEANDYFQQASDATAKYNATITSKPKKRLVTASVGSAAVYKAGNWGIDVTAGVNFGPVGIFGGAVYMFDGEDTFTKPGDLMYKAGLMFTF